MSRILVVDDDPQIVRALAINLRARGYEVSAARGGGEALQIGRRPAARRRDT
jgi:two-component system, OmpR family, KDP operon response regulator KdpE